MNEFFFLFFLLIDKITLFKSQITQKGHKLQTFKNHRFSTPFFDISIQSNTKVNNTQYIIFGK